ncbi:MAG: hypothetical protein KF779_14190 [Hyphomonadaceae bacterium]|nr:hypothetical protein [Hyphomonadaceae bacterium]MCA8886849.1 hypothetical protein [Hyphomonadaceae bacterium]
MSAILPWLALALLGVAIATAIGALLARSLFVSCLHVTVTGVSVAAVVLLLRGGDAAVALALFAAAWTPVLLMAAMLLSARVTKARQARRFPWLGLLSAAVAVVAIWWPLLDVVTSAPLRAQNELPGLSFWLAPPLLVAGIACVGALGFGERGSLRQRV